MAGYRRLAGGQMTTDGFILLILVGISAIVAILIMVALLFFGAVLGRMK